MALEHLAIDATTNRFRQKVAETARLPAPLTVEAAVSAVMCALTERLTAGEATAVLRAVPETIAPLFELCALHRAGQPASKLDRAAFLDDVATHLGVTPAHAELVTSAVFAAVRAEIPAEIIIHVGSQLPRGLKELWLGAPVSAPDLDTEIDPEGARAATLRDLELRAHLPAPITPEAAFSAVMCAFARRLSGGEARHVVLGLPLSLRSLVDRCTIHREEPAAVFGRNELLQAVGIHLGVDVREAEHIAIEVFRAAKRLLPQHVLMEVASQLPPDLRELWVEALPPHSR